MREKKFTDFVSLRAYMFRDELQPGDIAGQTLGAVEEGNQSVNQTKIPDVEFTTSTIKAKEGWLYNKLLQKSRDIILSLKDS